MVSNVNQIGLSGRCGFALLSVTVFLLPIVLVCNGVDLKTFIALTLVWLVVSAALIFGDDLTEITIWKASIKRDAKATRVAREEVEAIRDQLRKISAASVENTYIISGELLLISYRLFGNDHVTAMKTSPGTLRLFQNMNDVWKFAEPDETKAEQLRKKFRRDLGLPDE